jgi:hypothetical protein
MAASCKGRRVRHSSVATWNNQGGQTFECGEDIQQVLAIIAE